MIIRYPISGDRRFGDLQRIALILVWVTSVHLLTQVLYKKTVDAVTPSTGPITRKSAVVTYQGHEEVEHHDLKRSKQGDAGGKDDGVPRGACDDTGRGVRGGL
jgi:hypothetical protein